MHMGGIAGGVEGKVRLLSNLSEEELRKNQVDVTSLPAIGPAFWQQKETSLIARNLGFFKLIERRNTDHHQGVQQRYLRPREQVPFGRFTGVPQDDVSPSLSGGIDSCL